ncbi:MAG: alpha/beta hydrolase [Epsilonproteobacteria bacterium]|nr:alpha/beta hydrolase [Campylobacterota bacterium]
MFYILLSLLFIYLLAILYLYFTQDSKIFNFDIVPKKVSKATMDCKKCKSVQLVSEEAALDGVYKENGSNKLLMYFGGNSDDATEFVKYCDDLEEFDVVAFNYRGNALSDGKPSEEAIFKDSLKIYDTYAKDKEVYLVGRSLGSGVAVYLASKREVKKLLLITPYDSIENIAKEKYPFIPISLLLKHKFNSLKYIKKVNAPVEIFLVLNDRTVTAQRSENLIKNIADISRVVVFEDTTHADILDSPRFKTELKRWATV